MDAGKRASDGGYMSNVFYWIECDVQFPAEVPWGKACPKYQAYRAAWWEADKLRSERQKSINRFIRAKKRRNEFKTRLEAETFALEMGLPFKVKTSEACWAF